jgi:hypothetical protein
MNNTLIYTVLIIIVNLILVRFQCQHLILIIVSLHIKTKFKLCKSKCFSKHRPVKVPYFIVNNLKLITDGILKNVCVLIFME